MQPLVRFANCMQVNNLVESYNKILESCVLVKNYSPWLEVIFGGSADKKEKKIFLIIRKFSGIGRKVIYD
jgi:hypothetical protein